MSEKKSVVLIVMPKLLLVAGRGETAFILENTYLSQLKISQTG